MGPGDCALGFLMRRQERQYKLFGAFPGGEISEPIRRPAPVHRRDQLDDAPVDFHEAAGRSEAKRGRSRLKLVQENFLNATCGLNWRV